MPPLSSHRRLHVPSNILLLPSRTSAARLRQPCCPLMLTSCEFSRSRLCCVHGECDSTHTRQLPVLQLLTSMQRRSVLGSGGRHGCRWLLQCGGRKQGKRRALVALSGAPAAAGKRAAAPRPAAGAQTAPPAASPPCAAHVQYRAGWGSTPWTHATGAKLHRPLHLHQALLVHNRHCVGNYSSRWPL